MIAVSTTIRSQQRAARRASYWLGHWAEWLASVVLMLKGYRILARRCKTPLGEIDLIAVRGGILVFVEVKARATLEEAHASITRRQSKRLRSAAGLWLGRRSRYHGFEQRFDALYIIAGFWPHHVPAGA